LIVGSGPIVIGQACEFDHAGTQGCRALREEGFEVVLVNSNSATIMTDPETAGRTYIEPLTAEYVAKIIERERPDALLPTLGGQTALDLAVVLTEDGTLTRFGVELIGADYEAIRRAETNRRRFERYQEPAIGWKKLELEVMRDVADHVVVVCATESLDPVGVHAGDSITVTPAQTLGEEDYRRLRNAAVAIVREIGAGTDGASIELAVNPRDGRPVVIGMSPLVSRGSALASKATGFPIAKIAAKLAVGYTLDELPDGITGTLAAFEPARDRCVVKIPRWEFETFPEADPTLTGRMQSVGDVMAIGGTFKEALQKAVRSVAQGAGGLTLGRSVDERALARLLEVPTPERLWAIAEAYRTGWSTADVHAPTGIDPWFLDQVREIVAYERVIAAWALGDARVLSRAKRWGFADARLAELTGATERGIRALRVRHRITPAFETVDTCGGGPDGPAAYLYSTYAGEDGTPPTDRRKIVILGSGPNRIGQGLELDYCCVHAASALRARGVEAIVVNCNPAAVSTDGDTSDRLYVEPLTLEDVLNIVDRERPLGVIVQFGGQTPLALAAPLEQAGVDILGTSPDAIDRAGNRQRFRALLAELGLTPAAGATFLEEAIAVDVDAVSDGRRVLIGGVMEHIERAGVHSGDAACVLPPYSLGPDQVDLLHRQTVALARGLEVVGLFNVQFALKDDVVHVLEVNPGASRTVPFVSKAVGVPLAKLAADVLLGDALPTITPPACPRVAVKEAVFPFVTFAGVDVVLGPEMKSTGVVMGIDEDFRKAYLKSQLAAGARLPTSGKVWISGRHGDRRPLVMLAKRLGALGFAVVATGDTARVVARHGMDVESVPAGDAEHPQLLELMRDGGIVLAIDIPDDGRSRARSAPARREALRQNIPYYTTLDGAQAVIGALEVLLKGDLEVTALQDSLHGGPRTGPPSPPPSERLGEAVALLYRALPARAA
jgi:carbamoyl-phosphate synthase large subunit